jgi:hypothetical protein
MFAEGAQSPPFSFVSAFSKIPNLVPTLLTYDQSCLQDQLLMSGHLGPKPRSFPISLGRLYFEIAAKSPPYFIAVSFCLPVVDRVRVEVDILQ